ncbi:MAG: hypothetical protein WC564_05175 [Patescibacteria group bacterium]|jgi:hypothetical protein
MKRKIFFSFIVFIVVTIIFSGCGENSEEKDSKIVQKQQAHYAKVQPLPFYDYSIPRDILIQIYNVVTQDARNTYTVVETITGVTKFQGPSLGYGIPVDVSLTNPLQPAYDRTYNDGEIIEQSEPNGLFSSKNTDATWVLFLDDDGNLVPVYTEHKVMTFPFVVKKTEDGEWVRAGKEKASVTIDISSFKKS